MELGKIKAKVEKVAKTNNIDIQTSWDMFFFENFLYLLSISKFASYFVFKGGFYLQSIVGVKNRSTMDVDLKLIQNNISETELLNILKEICNYSKNKIVFTIKSINDIAAETKYGGKNVKIEGRFYNVTKTFNIDIGVGDVVTPSPVKYCYPSNFIEEECSLLAYPIETIIAEKFETLIAKGTNNSRVKDIFDLYLLDKLTYDEQILTSAIINTFHLRNTKYDKTYIEQVLNEVFDFERIKNLFDNYSRKHAFANGVKFIDCKKATFNIFSHINFNEKLDLKQYNIEIHIIRHGQDEQDKLGGWSNNHLTEQGIKEVEDLANIIDNRYDLFVSSDLERAKETANILNKHLNMDICFKSDFRELNNGDLANLTIKEASQNYPGLYFTSLKMNECYPNGESPIQFLERIKNAFYNFIEDNKNKKVLLVTHGGVITVILSLINGYEYSNLLKITPPTGSITFLK